jgi:hypothetical protein
MSSIIFSEGYSVSRGPGVAARWDWSLCSPCQLSVHFNLAFHGIGSKKREAVIPVRLVRNAFGWIETTEHICGVARVWMQDQMFETFRAEIISMAWLPFDPDDAAEPSRTFGVSLLKVAQGTLHQLTYELLWIVVAWLHISLRAATPVPRKTI